MTSTELRRRLDAAGYDTEAIDALSAELKVDLITILAGWEPTLAAITAQPKPARPPWWRRLWRRST